jgi:cytochrome P450
MNPKATLIRGFATASALLRMAHERLETGLLYNPTTAENLRDPYPMYRRFRESDPFHRSRLAGGWVLFRYADVLEVLKDPRFSADERNSPRFESQRKWLIAAGALDAEDPLDVSMLRMDPPDHTRLRGLVNRAFTPRSIEKLRPRIEHIVDVLLREVRGRSGMDLVDALAYPLPVIVISEMLGIPTGDRARFKHWSDEVVRTMGMASLEDVRASRTAAKELRAYFEGIVVERRREPQDDLISALLAAEEQGDKLSLPEVFSTLTLLLIAGNETTTNLIANGTLALLRQREQWELLCDDPDLVPGAVEELLRYDSPVQATSRICVDDVPMSGGTIRRGHEVILPLASANRDPEVFEDPDRLDVTRKDVRHLSFSQGIHYCLGAPLARLEAQIAFRALAERFPKLELAVDEPEWRRNFILRGPKALPVRI